MTRTELLLLIIGGLFVVITLSIMLGGLTMLDAALRDGTVSMSKAQIIASATGSPPV